MSREAQASSQITNEQRHPRVVRVGLLAGVPATFLTAASPAAKASATATPAAPTDPVTGTAPKWVNDVGDVVTHLFKHPIELVIVTVAVGAVAMALTAAWQVHQADDNGFAKRRELHKKLSAGRLRRKKTRNKLRPALADRKRRHVQATDLGFYTGTSVHNGHMDTYIPLGDPLAIVAPPGAGKTEYLLNNLLDAPGSAYATTTKWEPLFYAVAAILSLKGPVEWFNPQGLGDQESTIAWDPVRGCRDPEVAMRRAGYLLSGSSATKGTENRSFWSGSNFDVLKSLLWVADVAGLTLLDVARWSKSPADRTPLEIMKKHGAPPVNWDSDLLQVMENPNDKTTLSIFKTLALTFSFLADPKVAQIVLSARTVANPFDPAAHMLAKGTLFMLGEDREYASIGPLFTALTGEIYHTAVILGSRMRGARMEPPPTFILDEAALICSVPLERWTSDARGRGITIHLAMQTKSQLYDRWGKHAADTIWSNCTKLILGGLGGEEAEAISRDCGYKMVTHVTTSTSTPQGGQQGGMLTPSPRSVSKTPHRELVMEAADVSSIDFGHMLLMRRQTKPVMVTYGAASERKDVKRELAAIARAEKAALKDQKRQYRDAKKAAKQGQPQVSAIWDALVANGPVVTAAPAWTQQPVQAPVQQPVQAPAAAYVDEWSDEPDYAAPAWYAQNLPHQREASVYAEQWPEEGLAPVPPQASPAAPVLPPVPQHAPTAHLQPDLTKPHGGQAAEASQEPAPVRERRNRYSEFDEEVG